jgi:hypothetical protein
LRKCANDSHRIIPIIAFSDEGKKSCKMTPPREKSYEAQDALSSDNSVTVCCISDGQLLCKIIFGLTGLSLTSEKCLLKHETWVNYLRTDDDVLSPRAGHRNCQKYLGLSKHTDIAIHWKALEELFSS